MKNRSKRIIRLSMYCLYLIVSLAIYEHVFVYHVKMNGSSYETINVYSTYKDPGILVKLRGRKYNKVKIEGNVDTKKFGIYKIKYVFGNRSRERIVEVKDIEKPIIKLNGEDITLNYKEEYKDPGFKITDNYDGDISNKAIVINGVNSNILGEYNVMYYVKDSSNNESVVKRKVIVDDIEAPKISFNNRVNTFAIKGKKKSFNDFKAIDNYDGIITDKVKVSGDINFNKEGVYNLTYSVKDSHNNETTIDRIVNVQEKNTNGIPVLMYHWFYDDTKGETNRGLANSHNYISKTQLTEQLEYLTNNGFYFPTWSELIDYIDNKIDLPSKSIILTDDDCKDSFFDIALPLFQDYKVPVTSFCITSKRNWQKYKTQEYLEFESHTDDLHDRSCNTYWNGAVMCKSYDEISEDIKLSIKKVGSSYAFAYPFGHYNDTTIKALKDNGIKLAFTTYSGRVKRNYNKYILPRVRISSSTTIDEYKNLVD